MNRGLLSRLDWGLLLPTVAVIILSLTTLFSIHIDFFKSQLLYVTISLFAYIFFSLINTRLIQLYAFPIYVASIVCFVVVLILGIESHGAVRWIDILGFRIQFSEVFKPFLILSLATFLSQKEPTFNTFIKTIAFFFPLIFLVFIQPDLGNAMIYTFVFVLTLLTFGFPLLWFGIGFCLLVGFLPLLWKILHEYQRQRILTFFNPSKDPLGSSYNVIQSVIAVGSGMIMGKGLGEATQSKLRFLPERHTDFIFATLSEGLGFIGTVIILICFIVLLCRIYIIAKACEDPFSKLFTIQAFFLILVQFSINVGMNIGIIPIAGITLPFLSYGGSSLLSNCILLGILSAINSTLRHKNVLEIG